MYHGQQKNIRIVRTKRRMKILKTFTNIWEEGGPWDPLPRVLEKKTLKHAEISLLSMFINTWGIDGP